MYGIEGRSWVALGDPVDQRRNGLNWSGDSVKCVTGHAGWTVFYEVGREDLHLYLDLGLSLLKLGEEALIPLDSFSLKGEIEEDYATPITK